MKITRTLYFSALCSVAFLGSLLFFPAHASTTKAKPPPPPVDKRILVTNVDVPNQQLAIVYQDNKKREVYIVDQLTAVTVQGHKATLKDIKVGQQVLDYVERDEQSLDSVSVATAGPSAAVSTKKK